MNELLSLENVFNKRLFRIPDYQRGYAWGIKQLTDFWEDLVSLDGDRYHYTGVLSIKKVSEEKWSTWNDEQWLIDKRKFTPFFVVDGQQRLTTSSIFLQCLVEQIIQLEENKDLSDEDIYLGSYNLKEIKQTFIVISQPPLYAIKTYLFGYEVDNPSFSYLRYKIYNEGGAGTVNETFYTLNLENAKQFFTENLEQVVNDQGAEGLEELYEKITQRFMFNLYEISDDFDVFVAFETMNNRGKLLSDLELLKNRLIYLTTLYRKGEVNENDKIAIRENINNAWREIYFQLGRNKNQPLNDDDFLRAHWIMYFKYSRKKGDDYIRFLLDEEFSPKKVFTKVHIKTNKIVDIEEVREREDQENENNDEDGLIDRTSWKAKLPISVINDYVSSLKTSARHWYNTFNPENNSDLDAEESILLDRLNRIRIGYFRPLVMASFVNEKINRQDRISLLSAIERFIFLEFRVSRAMSNYRSSVYYNAARELYTGETSALNIIKLLFEDSAGLFDKDGYFKHFYFKEHIESKFRSGGSGFYGWNGLSYFLFEYEEEQKKYRNQPKISWKHFVKSEKDKVSIEHILPQTPTEACWQNVLLNIPEDKLKYIQGSLGNLLALSSSINSTLQNDCFNDKKNTKLDNQNHVIRNGYANGSYSEQEVAREENWTTQEILERGIRLLNFMESRWNIKFASYEDKVELLHLGFLLNVIDETAEK